MSGHGQNELGKRPRCSSVVLQKTNKFGERELGERVIIARKRTKELPQKREEQSKGLEG